MIKTANDIADTVLWKLAQLKSASDSNILDPAVGTASILGGGAAGAGVLGSGYHGMQLEKDLSKAMLKSNVPEAAYRTSDAFKKIREAKLPRRLMVGGAIGAGIGGVGYGAYRMATKD